MMMIFIFYFGLFFFVSGFIYGFLYHDTFYLRVVLYLVHVFYRDMVRVGSLLAVVALLSADLAKMVFLDFIFHFVRS